MAATCIKIVGGFEGLGDPEMDAQIGTSKQMRTTTMIETHNKESYDGTSKQMRTTTVLETHNKESYDSISRQNPEVNAVSYPPEGSKAKATEKYTSTGYPLWPRPSTLLNITTLPESDSNSDPEPSIQNKKVRINAYVGVKEISELGLDNTKDTSYEIIKLEHTNNSTGHRADETNKNIKENSEYSIWNIFKLFKGLKDYKKNRNKNLRKLARRIYDSNRLGGWEIENPKIEEENWTDLEVVNKNLDEIQKYKTSSTLAEPNLENIQGNIYNSSSSDKIEARQKLRKKLN